MSQQVEAVVPVPWEIAQTLPKRPDRVRECMNAAEQALEETAAERGRRIAHAPRLFDQVPRPLLGVVELHFFAETVKR